MKLRVIANAQVPETRTFNKEASHLRLVPDCEENSIALVKRYARMVEKDSDPFWDNHPRVIGRIPTTALLGALYCLSPNSTHKLLDDLRSIAECSINSDVRIAAVMKIFELDGSI